MTSGILGLRHLSLNGLFLPANLAVQQTRRTCVSLHIVNDDPDWPVSNRGTAFLYWYRGRRFGVFSWHQVKDRDPEKICVQLTNEGGRLFSGCRITRFRARDSDIEEHDLCAIEFPASIPVDPAGPLFFNARTTTPPGDGETEECFCIGYPSTLTEMAGDYRVEAMSVAQVLVWADEVSRPAKGLHMLRLGGESQVMQPRCQGNYDGFSGGPVFAASTISRAIEFRGTILRGGHDRLFYVPAPWIDRLCDIALREEPLNSMAA